MVFLEWIIAHLRQPILTGSRLAHVLPSCSIVMRLSETITIYLAAGAPFGVTSYLSRSLGQSRARAAIRATGTAFLWPLAGLAILFRLRRSEAETTHDRQKRFNRREIEKIETAQRRLLAALNRFQELAGELFDKESKKMERAASIIRERVETYTGLMIAAADVSVDDAPDKREMELSRIAGRTGDDLLRAGRCIHRRNVARIYAHRERARTQLIHALAEVRETADDVRLTSFISGHATRDLSEAILKIMGRAIELCSLLDDESAAMSVARLLDVQCAHLNRLEDFQPEEAHEARAEREESCTDHAPPLAFTGPSTGRTLTQG